MRVLFQPLGYPPARGHTGLARSALRGSRELEGAPHKKPVGFPHSPTSLKNRKEHIPGCSKACLQGAETALGAERENFVLTSDLERGNQLLEGWGLSWALPTAQHL